MSRIGKKPVQIPDKVKVAIEARTVKVEGPKGKLSLNVHPRVTVTIEDNRVIVKRKSDLKLDKSLHGLTRSLINNMIIGVTDGYRKDLEIIGVGFKAAVQGKQLVLNLGFSHPINYAIPEGITIQVPKPLNISVSGFDKRLVGQTAAEIRDFHRPEPYKGKGIRYAGEYVRRKVGKKVA
ncbi:MAG: 50S ribosomal protein L6 [Candidatus Omnitrophica bacterium CG12_big_fil_rev_8_21_14_0_65_43_15]|uniref:Large ribosomal subunit protein uL6 n=1 Tax=Candidatus Taenaricola geysiri TaxID=1974752 RepID=A0A2J0LMC2_9BACT|nr:MAG: 50S ribosomal protein L6 [Candidatus Omnitrophica bacterium CG1_02_43_210]PIR66042.1 MAG: 50S ribosomal protein L6 [Candidatus Omnitrophica bacterium CG10_big_fil_rev_8_21_14_0_10_43_8]PIV12120.1 MAG: 50S ribosomal protein L6 [Candidatus Omnitrophica bacterium CG03_land_8_20_14_0_80_43_22]PIW66743.1 MAG: 50S ribosomal protein L6 [Candidatus Omnitrophica bacterium CG12_big_fil_rev_8_21_14_0_65_43_15]PIW79770.1 MAG: 50S ribosomal protein L6 [Candidatus Omnitrophica bacterium CG_4_8_14_3_u